MSVDVKKAFEYLDNMNLIKYDRYLSRDSLEKAFGITFDPRNPMTYFGPFILFQHLMEKRGFMTTTRNTNPGDLRILPAHMNHVKTKRRQKKYFRQNERARECLENTDRSELNNNEQKKLSHSLHTLSLMTQCMNSILRDIKY